jgi:hypothetical protein
MATLTAQNIIDAAFLNIGVLDGERTITPTTNQYADALTALNNMIGSWNLENLLVYAVNRYVFPFIPGQQFYTLGSTNAITGSISGNQLTVTSGTPVAGQMIIGYGIPDLTTVVSGSNPTWTLSNQCGTISGETFGCVAGNNWNIPRPSRLERWSVHYPAGSAYTDLPGSLISLEEWQAITYNTAPSAFPTKCYNDTNYPYMNLSFYPVPEAPCYAILWVWDQLQEITGASQAIQLATNIGVPQGYNEALIYNLSVRLAPMYGIEPPPTVLLMAVRSKSNINDINSGTPIATLDPAYCSRRVASIGISSRGYSVP